MSTVINARGMPLSTSATPVNHFSATAAGPLLEGTRTHDSFWGDARVTVTLAGGTGDDTYHIYSTGNRPSEEAAAGIDTIETWMSYSLPPHIENLTVTDNGRQASGNDLDNILTGGSGKQTLNGGPGDDVLIGRGGGDIFAVTAGNGSDRILDFTGADSVRLTGYGFTSFDDVAERLVQRGGDTVLDLGGGEVLAFAGTEVGDFTAEQFALELDISGLAPSFTEEFDTLSLRNDGAGTWDSNFWWGAANGSTLAGQENWYIDTDYGPTQSVNPFSVEDGVLTITAAAAPQPIRAEIDGHAYTSGLLNTYSSFAQTYGYFEIRADMPEGRGLWPAFWLLPGDGDWPPELDVIEQFGQDPERLILTVHSQASGSHTIDGQIANVSDTAGFHTYGVLWGPEEITWTYDGVAVWQTDTPADLHEPMYMLVNLGVGGIAGTPGAAVAAGAEMKVDYIRAYALTDPEQALPNDGDDILTGSAAPDTLDGGRGNDELHGLAGDDLLLGGDGDDTLRGAQGTDRFDGGAGSDTITFPGSNLSVEVDLAAGFAKAAGAIETLISIENASAGNANDVLRGDGGANVLSGRAGSDSLAGAGGDDWLDGGAGADTYSFAGLDQPGGDGQDSIAGFARDADILSFSDVLDADDDGTVELDDLLASVGSLSNPGPDGDVTASFNNGASITFTGVGPAASLTDLVEDATSQIQVS